MRRPPKTPGPFWYLRGLGEGEKAWIIEITKIPFRVGRRPGLDLTLPAESVSGEHAELYHQGPSLRVRDLGSTNGTFVNRRRIKDAEVHEGDVLHFADLEFQVGQMDDQDRPRRTTAVVPKLPAEVRFVQGTRELGELIRDRAVASVYQPILELPSRKVIGYEALGRGRHPGLPQGPSDLFKIAKSINREVELSALFREQILETVCERTDLPALFLNTHPSEVGRPDHLRATIDAALSACKLKLVIEIHEAAIVEIKGIADLKERLATVGVQLAYDDFGSGQARLLELAEVPPDYLKFDIRFVRGIDQSSASKRRLLGSLVKAARDLGVHTLAEGIETEGEAETCVELGFTHAQGFYYSYPIPLEEIDLPSGTPPPKAP
jgi:EAL domain-containing protein (putative c-di-GMP-specific phosphodiesterase class I)